MIDEEDIIMQLIDNMTYDNDFVSKEDTISIINLLNLKLDKQINDCFIDFLDENKNKVKVCFTNDSKRNFSIKGVTKDNESYQILINEKLISLEIYNKIISILDRKYIRSYNEESIKQAKVFNTTDCMNPNKKEYIGYFKSRTVLEKLLEPIRTNNIFEYDNEKSVLNKNYVIKFLFDKLKDVDYIQKKNVIKLIKKLCKKYILCIDSKNNFNCVNKISFVALDGSNMYINFLVINERIKIEVLASDRTVVLETSIPLNKKEEIQKIESINGKYYFNEIENHIEYYNQETVNYGKEHNVSIIKLIDTEDKIYKNNPGNDNRLELPLDAVKEYQRIKKSE